MRTILRTFVLSLISTYTVHATPGATATLILFNGQIWTENPGQPEAEAVAIDGQHILAVGPSADIRTLAGPNCSPHSRFEVILQQM